MSNRKTVAHTFCPTGKRSFETEWDAEKALGRAQAKRKRGNVRGGSVESRFYYCDECEGFHLTSMSRRSYNDYSGLVAA